MEYHLMRVDKESWTQTSFLPWGKSGALNVKIDESEEQAKFGFPVTAVTACKANFEKSYLTQFWSELSHSYAQFVAPDV